MYLPPISSESKRVLQIIKEHGVCKGRQLQAEAGLDDAQLIKAVTELVNSDLVSATGGTFSLQDISHAYFNIRPSNSSLAEFVLRS
ncbi:MAG TPA: hypothetical protein VJM50_19455 [Pyrinomonadaceae bacterium]|nr:hypothetical protein [Pyrinomonadaceae bacterium]